MRLFQHSHSRISHKPWQQSVPAGAADAETEAAEVEEIEAAPDPEEAAEADNKMEGAEHKGQEVLDTPPHHQNLAVTAITFMETRLGTAWLP